MADNSENSEIVEDNSQQLAIIEPEDMAKPKRAPGRPLGSRDKVPRRSQVRRRPSVVIREEAPREPSPPPPKRASKPYGQCTVRIAGQQEAPVRPTEPAPNEFPAPPSPRTLFRQASETMAQLQTQRESARRAYWHDAINRTLR